MTPPRRGRSIPDMASFGRRLPSTLTVACALLLASCTHDRTASLVLTIEPVLAECRVHMSPSPNPLAMSVGWLVTITETEGVAAQFTHMDVQVKDLTRDTVLLDDPVSPDVVAERWHAFEPRVPARGTLSFLYLSHTTSIPRVTDLEALRGRVVITAVDESGHTLSAAADFPLTLSF